MDGCLDDTVRTSGRVGFALVVVVVDDAVRACGRIGRRLGEAWRSDSAGAVGWVVAFGFRRERERASVDIFPWFGMGGKVKRGCC